MKRIESPDDTITLSLSRDEFHGLRDALSNAVRQLEYDVSKRKEIALKLEGTGEDQAYDVLFEAGFDEDNAEEFGRAIKREEALLAQFCGLSHAIEKITEEGDLARLL
jgi:hypothetical protein